MMDSCSGSVLKVCFNSTCKQSIEVPTQGWLCRTGDFADLCDRCASAFKDGKFCDTYHLNASGWRCCESCGKKIHCGCIVSFHMFVLLDAGGIECLNCAKTEYILTPNPSWPSAFHSLHVPSEKIKDVSTKNWRYITGSDPVPWQQAPSLFGSSKSQHELQLTSCSLGQSKTIDPRARSVNDGWPVCAPEITGDRAQTTGIQYDVKHSWFKDDSFRNLSSLQETFMAHDQKSENGRVSGIHVQQLAPPPSVSKQCSNNNNNETSTSLGNQARNAKDRGEPRARHQLLSYYSPQSKDQEHQQYCGGCDSSTAKITPLFEKVLSVSDAGKMGRLVVPKKYAEAYLPPISEPEGCPLAIQDLKGTQWVLQYRLWPNNNSRIYVLEGMTPCIQSMQLRAGDTVTFSKLEPEGKLIMGCRKASVASPSHKQSNVTTTSVFVHEDALNDNKSRNQDGTWSDVDIISNRAKRKKMCSDSKYLKFSFTLEQAQGLLQPTLSSSPTVVLIDGVEFEVFQEAPIIGSSSEFSTDNVRSLCSTKAETTPEHLEYMLPMINHENPESSNTMNGLYALADLADHDGKATTKHPHHKHGCTCIVCIQPPSGSNHKSTCKHSTTPPPRMQNPSQLLYADIIRYTRMVNSNIISDHKSGAGQTSENNPSKEKPSSLSFKSQNIDLNILPEREEESSPVSGSMGITKVVQESKHTYINMQKPSINGNTDGYHINHDL
ncbi:B3 domain-containing protein Os07g0563300-like [Bidens hawaiensis]|uniref:B3 domain-containing protein Os07g0563300-like n=1 Tax=Bidens hawaiensis TaxID=980011 RepID=UPI00404A4D66